MYFGTMYLDYYYFLLVIPALIISLIAQANVSSSFSKYSKIKSSRGLTGYAVARQILDSYGFGNVDVAHVPGNLSDHFDPRTNVVYLSDSVYNSASIAAIGVAAHEAGHAVQYGENYVPIKARGGFLPVAKLGSTLSVPILIAGLIFSLPFLVNFGLILFSAVAVFQLVTLPVEFNASRRALEAIQGGYYLYEDEIEGARKVLNAAAMTYVAALIMSIAQLLRLVMLYGGRGRKR